MQSKNWLALMIGNSRLHWGLFAGKQLIEAWSSQYLSRDRIELLIAQSTQSTCESFLHLINYPSVPPLFPSPPPVLLASVVPTQTKLWENYPQLQIISLADIPIDNMYPTLGCDRALALFAAGKSWGFPVLVIDAGTALTFTGADPQQSLMGGAILPGLGLQLKTLAHQTGQLPQIELSTMIISRWGQNTTEAIHSGVIYTLLAGINDFVQSWWQNYPHAKIIMTGGDAMFLKTYMQSIYPQIYSHIDLEPNLVLHGIAQVRQYQLNQSAH